MVGIRTKAGELLINPKTSEWTLLNAGGKVLIPRHEIGGLNSEASSANTNVTLMLGWDRHQPVSVYGCGNGVDALQQSKTTNRGFQWPGSHSLLLVAGRLRGSRRDDQRQPSRRLAWSTANGEYLTWIFPGREGELYLMPAASLKAATEADARLTGFAPVPPLWAFGYLQSRYGWKSRAYIEDALEHFQELKIPVDAFIYDFEWFTAVQDYEVPPEGVPGYTDFGWNTNLFPEPAEQIRDYKNQGVHFVGIRKPRLGNAASLAMIRSKGWNLPVKSTETVSRPRREFCQAWLSPMVYRSVGQPAPGWN